MDDLITDYTALGVKAAEPVPLSGKLYITCPDFHREAFERNKPVLSGVEGGSQYCADKL